MNIQHHQRQQSCSLAPSAPTCSSSPKRQRRRPPPFPRPSLISLLISIIHPISILLLQILLLLAVVPIITNNHDAIIAHAFSPPGRSSTTITTSSGSSTNPLAKKPPITIADEIGCSPTFGYAYFDPFNLASEETFPFYREAELKHGRIAMLATLGMTLPDWFRTVLVPHKNTPLSKSQHVNFQDVPNGIKALKVVPVLGWIQIILFIGFLEVFVFVMRDKNDMPGDYGVGYFGLRDKARHERSLLSELENGRLAMIAFMGQVVSELVTGKTIGEQFHSAFSHLKW